MMKDEPRRHAIVMGASMTGLLSSRLLAERFEHVTLIERDVLCDEREPRKGVPQGKHAHALLPAGLQVIQQLFPGIRDALVQDGATSLDLNGDVRWWHGTGYRQNRASGLESLMQTRPLLEQHLRRRVRQLPNLTVLDGHEALNLQASPDGGRITGVRVRPRDGSEATFLEADLVVDASGRASRTPALLKRVDSF